MQMSWSPKETAKKTSWSQSLALLIMLVFHGLAMAEVTLIQTGKNGERNRELCPAAFADSPGFTLKVDELQTIVID